jgi:hypothetical protein
MAGWKAEISAFPQAEPEGSRKAALNPGSTLTKSVTEKENDV